MPDACSSAWSRATSAYASPSSSLSCCALPTATRFSWAGQNRAKHSLLPWADYNTICASLTCACWAMIAMADLLSRACRCSASTSSASWYTLHLWQYIVALITHDPAQTEIPGWCIHCQMMIARLLVLSDKLLVHAAQSQFFISGNPGSGYRLPRQPGRWKTHWSCLFSFLYTSSS